MFEKAEAWKRRAWRSWLVLCVAVLIASIGTARASMYDLTTAYLVSRFEDEGVATPDRRVGLEGEPIRVHLVIEGRARGRLPIYYTDAPALDLGQGILPSRQVRRWDPRRDGAIDIQWKQIEPVNKTYDNLTPRFHFESIEYRETDLPALDDQWSFPAAAHPTLLPDSAPNSSTGLGTMRFSAKIVHQGQTLRTPGEGGRFSGGISSDVFWVAYRGRNPTPLVSWAQSLFNIPFIAGPAARGGGADSQQSITAVGTDSVDLAIAAWRRLGHREVDFIGQLVLDPKHPSRTTLNVARAGPSPEGYRMLDGQPLSSIRRALSPAI